jgi:hypothetical protein
MKDELISQKMFDLEAITVLLNSRGWQLVKESIHEERERKKENLTISSETEDEVLKGVCQGLLLALDMPELIKKDLKSGGENK